MNPKHEKFIQSYLVSSNATEAAREAGYTCKNLRSQGSRLLTRADIRNEIEKRQSKAASEAGMEAAEVLRGVAEIALKGERERDRLRAFELLGKRHKLWIDKAEIIHQNTEPVINLTLVKE